MSGLGKRQADWEEDRQIAKGGKKSMGIKEGWKDFMGWELEVVVGPGGKGGGGGHGVLVPLLLVGPVLQHPVLLGQQLLQDDCKQKRRRM